MKKKRKVDELTSFLAGLAEKTEKKGHGIYHVIANNEDLQRLCALSGDGSSKIKEAVRMFVSQSFNDMMSSICMQIALLLLEIKNQHDAFENDGTPVDIQKLESMGGESAEKFRILADVTKKAAKSVDWDYVAERIIAAGEAATAKPELEKPEDIGPFSAN